MASDRVDLLRERGVTVASTRVVSKPGFVKFAVGDGDCRPGSLWGTPEQIDVGFGPRNPRKSCGSA